MLPLALTAGDVSLLVGAAVTLLTLVGSGIVWLIKQGREQGALLTKVEMLSRGTHEQVRNSHVTNLRNDVDKAVDGTRRNEELLLGVITSLERLERTVNEDREDRMRADRETRTELDHVRACGEREHRSLWQRLGDSLGVARPGEIDVPDEPY